MRGLLVSLLLAVVLALGIGAAWGLAVSWILAVHAELARSDRDYYEFLAVLRDGTPVVYRRNVRSRSYEDREVVTLDGQRIEVDPHESYLSSTWLAGPTPLPYPLEDWSRRLNSYNDGQRPATYWYLIHDGQPRGRGYFVGYHSISCRVEGYVSQRGFVSELPAADEQFPIALLDVYGVTTVVGDGYGAQQPSFGINSSVAFYSDGRVWRVDFKTRSLETVLEDAEAFVARPLPRSARDLPPPLAVPPTETQMILRTPDELRVVDVTSLESVRRYRLPPEFRGKTLHVYDQPDGTLLLQEQPGAQQGGIQSTELAWIDTQGEVVRQATLRLVTGGIAWNPLKQPEVGLAVMPSPAALAFLSLVGLPGSDVYGGASPDWRTARNRTLGRWWPVLALSLLVSLICAVFTWRRHARWKLAHGWVWFLFVLVGGIPAWLAYLAHRLWPARMHCPACGQRVPCDRDACSDCRHAFAAPPRRGHEVFA